jgi:riboflavin biosynthesis pyrimidine reductase
MDALVTLFDDTLAPATPVLVPALQALYGGDLALPQSTQVDFVAPPLGAVSTARVPGVVSTARAACYANFVTTLDGIVSFNLPAQDTGNAISGGSAIDHAVMAILRAVSDAVIWGNATYQASLRFVPTPEAVWPSAAALLRAQRAHLGKPERPIAVIVSASGRVDATGAIVQQDAQPTIIATTDAGAARLGALPAHVAVWSFGDAVTPLALLGRLYAERGVAAALCEGGPVLLGSFLAADALDEIFLTRAPQFAGSSPAAQRPGLVAGVAFAPATAPWATLRSLKRSGSYLFERYALTRGRTSGAALP